jgi:hypothetical protein
MTINIIWNNYTLFSIEWWLKLDDDSELWCSAFEDYPCVRGLVKFIENRLGSEGFNVEDFINDSEKIKEWWIELYNPGSTDKVAASKKHNQTFTPALMDLINVYCSKYGLEIKRM